MVVVVGGDVVVVGGGGDVVTGTVGAGPDAFVVVVTGFGVVGALVVDVDVGEVAVVDGVDDGDDGVDGAVAEFGWVAAVVGLLEMALLATAANHVPSTPWPVAAPLCLSPENR